MHDVYVQTVKITWEGQEADMAALETALRAGNTKGAALIREYADALKNGIDYAARLLSYDGGDLEDWPYLYFRQIQADFPGAAFIFDITFRGVAGQQHLLAEEDFMEEIRFKTCPEHFSPDTDPLASINSSEPGKGYFPQNIQVLWRIVFPRPAAVLVKAYVQ